MKKVEEPRDTTRVTTYLTESQVESLERIGRQAMFTTGVKLPMTTILGCWAELLTRLEISGKGIHNGEQLLERVRITWNEKAKHG